MSETDQSENPDNLEDLEEGNDSSSASSIQSQLKSKTLKILDINDKRSKVFEYLAEFTILKRKRSWIIMGARNVSKFTKCRSRREIWLIIFEISTKLHQRQNVRRRQEWTRLALRNLDESIAFSLQNQSRKHIRTKFNKAS